MSDQADRMIIADVLRWHAQTAMPIRKQKEFQKFLERLLGPKQADLFGPQPLRKRWTKPKGQPRRKRWALETRRG